MDYIGRLIEMPYQICFIIGLTSFFCPAVGSSDVKMNEDTHILLLATKVFAGDS